MICWEIIKVLRMLINSMKSGVNALVGALRASVMSLEGKTCQSMLYIRRDVLEEFKEATVSSPLSSPTTKHEETLLPSHSHKADTPPITAETTALQAMEPPKPPPNRSVQLVRHRK